MTEQHPYYGDEIAAANLRASISRTNALDTLDRLRVAQDEINRLRNENGQLIRENLRLKLALEAWRGLCETAGYANADQFGEIEQDEQYQAWGRAAINRLERANNERRYGSGVRVIRRGLDSVVAGPVDQRTARAEG